MNNQSLQNFLEYLESEEELRLFIRNNADWNENSFIKMNELLNELMSDYKSETNYPKIIVLYFMVDIPSIIEMLSHFKFHLEADFGKGYTQKSYEEYISERINKLKSLKKDFIKSLY